MQPQTMITEPQRTIIEPEIGGSEPQKNIFLGVLETSLQKPQLEAIVHSEAQTHVYYSKLLSFSTTQL